MKATDLIKSLAATNSINSFDFKVVTFYKNQTRHSFLSDNLGTFVGCNPDISAPSILEKQDYLAVFKDLSLSTPDGKSTLEPDHEVIMADGYRVLLYKFN